MHLLNADCSGMLLFAVVWCYWLYHLEGTLFIVVCKRHQLTAVNELAGQT